MDKQINRNLRWGYGLSLILLSCLGGWGFFVFSSLLAGNQAVRHSNEVILKLEQVMSIMKDAETGQRGYLLTNKKEFLQPYEGAYGRAQKLLHELELMTGDNHKQQQNIKIIGNVLVNRLSILQKLVEKQGNSRMFIENDLVAGKQSMDRLRAEIDKSEQHEQSLLAEREAKLDNYISWTPALVIGTLIFGVSITGFSYYRVIRELRENERIRLELMAQEAETAALNEELTAANEEVTASNEELTAINEELLEARDELQTLNDHLEQRVEERTLALKESEEETQALNEELTAINEELNAANEEYQATNEDLILAKDELERSEELFRSIAENIPGSLLMVIDLNHRLIALEGDRIGQLDYHADDYEGKHIRDVTSPERYDTNKELYDRVTAGEHFRIERKTDQGQVYQVDFVPLKNESGRVYAGLIIALDVTEIRLSEEKSAKLAAIIESTDDAIISKSLDGIITSWNRGAERLFGYSESEMIGQSILKVIPEDRLEEEPMIIANVRAGRRIERMETKRLANDGRLVDMSLTISPVKDRAGNIIGVSKIARDITEQKQDEQRKNDFIGMASHELKTPLTSLSGLLQMMQIKLRNSEDTFIPGALVNANQQIKRMTALINGFLNVSRLESSKLFIEKRPFDIGQLIVEMIAEVMLTAPGHQFTYNGSANYIVDADREKIASVVSNLLSNAVKYSPKGKYIKVGLKVATTEVTLSVHDEGMGIKPEDIDKLFDRYYRVSSEHTKYISGFGVGLYLSSEIVKHHGGRIWVESEKAVGSTFFFTIPVS